MCAWGQKRGIDDLLTRLSANDASLQSLYLMKTRQFGHAEATQLCQVLINTNSILKELDLSSHAISVETAGVFAQLLAANPALKSLSLGNSTFGDEALKALCVGLSTNTTLERLDLEAKGISAAGCVALADALSSNSTLQQLILARNDAITAQGLEIMYPSLSSISYLDLSGCGLTAEAAQHTANLLETATALHTLLYDDNILDLQGAKVIGSSLKAAQGLKHLSLRGTKLTPEGASHLAAHLPSTLDHLDLSSTDAGSQGTLALAKALAADGLTCIKTLLMCENNIDGAAIAELGISLSNSQRSVAELMYIDLGGNQVTAEALQALSECRCVDSLRLFDCKLHSDTATVLCTLIQQGGFNTIRDLDVSANGMEADVLLELFKMLASAEASSALETIVVAANPGLESDAVDEAVKELNQVRPGLRVVRRNADTGEQQQQRPPPVG